MQIQDVIERVLTIPVAQAKVWEAISGPDGLSRWFASIVSGDFRPGGMISFQWEAHETSEARIEAIEPQSHFSYWWRPGADQPAGLPFDETPKTLVEFFLESIETGTRVTLRESGFASLPEAMRDAAWKDNTGGWDEELVHLTSYLTLSAG